MIPKIITLPQGLISFLPSFVIPIDTEYKWVEGNLSYPVPANAIIGGFDPYGYYTYVGRVIWDYNVLPARVVTETGIAHFNTDTFSAKILNYQLLIKEPNVDFVWQRSYDGFREEGAVSVGTTRSNERVFICRSRSDGGLLVGTLYLSKQACIIQSDTLPLRKFDKYEILVAKEKKNSTFY